MTLKKIEIWKSVPGYPRYRVSNRGRVRSLSWHDSAGKFHKSRRVYLTPMGKFQQIALFGIDGETLGTKSVAWLMLAAFVRLPLPGELALHWDDDQTHNVLSNIRWGTRKDNMSDAIRNGRQGKGSSAAAKISVALLDHSVSKKTRRKIGLKSKDRVVSQETRDRMSAAHMGHSVSQETRDKLSNAHLGKRYTKKQRRAAYLANLQRVSEQRKLKSKSKPP